MVPRGICVQPLPFSLFIYFNPFFPPPLLFDCGALFNYPPEDYQAGGRGWFFILSRHTVLFLSASSHSRQVFFGRLVLLEHLSSQHIEVPLWSVLTVWFWCIWRGPRHLCKDQTKANEKGRYEALYGYERHSNGTSWKKVFSVCFVRLYGRLYLLMWENNAFVVSSQTRMWQKSTLLQNLSFFYPCGCTTDSSECFALLSRARTLPCCNKASARGTLHRFRGFLFFLYFRCARLMQSSSFFLNKCSCFSTNVNILMLPRFSPKLRFNSYQMHLGHKCADV